MDSDCTDKDYKIINSKVLVVGAGGIGCELVKVIALSGFNYITIIDLDTISVSNLNRQFLFNRSHVGQSKAEVVKQSVKALRPDANIVSYHSNIESPTFDCEFYKNFSLVFNALDNIDARRHVNKMCNLANVWLIDGGTTGFLGQVHHYKKFSCACYDCEVKRSNDKTVFPVCTIRNTPSKIIHCVVWAKHIFEILFGNASSFSAIHDELETSNGIQDIVKMMSDNSDEFSDELLDSYLYYIFISYFYFEIKKLHELEDLWVSRKRPVPMVYYANYNSPSNMVKASMLNSHEIYQFSHYVFIYNLIGKKLIKRKQLHGHILFEKDDDEIIDFITCLTNIRATIFHIPNEIKFEIRSMVGSIIPAVATTNAIIASAMTAEAFKVLSKNTDLCHSVYISKGFNFHGNVLSDCKLSKPNPMCYTCSLTNELFITVNIFSFKMDDLLKFLSSMCGISDPDIMDNISGKLIFSSDDFDNEKINSSLNKYSICDGSILFVEDFTTSHKLSLIIKHSNELNACQFESISKFYEIMPLNTGANDPKKPISESLKKSTLVSDIFEDFSKNNNLFNSKVVVDVDTTDNNSLRENKNIPVLLKTLSSQIDDSTDIICLESESSDVTCLDV